MMGEHLRVLGMRPLAGVACVQPHAVRHEQASVRDVAQQRVVEPVAAVDLVEVVEVDEPAQRTARRREVGPRERGHILRLEGLAHDRAVGQHSPLGRVELVEPRAQRSLERHRDVVRGAPRELHDEERVAASTRDRTVRRARISRKLARLGIVQALELDEESVPARADARRLRELGPRGRDDEHPNARGADPIDEPDDVGCRPVHVLDPEHERAARRKAAQEAGPGVRDLVAALVRAERCESGAAAQPRGVREHLGDAHPLAGVVDRRRDSVLEAVVGARPEQELADRRERADLSTRPAARLGQCDGAKARDELPHEPGLALAGRPAHEREDRPASRGPAMGHSQQLELTLAADERQVTARAGADLVQLVDLERADALELDRTERRESSGIKSRVVRDRADEHLTGLRALLKSRRRVHDRAHAQLLACRCGCREVHDRLTGLHTDTDGERDLRLRSRQGPVTRARRRAKRPQGVVRMGDRRAEDRVDGVADVLLHGAALVLDEPPQTGEGRIERGLQPLRAERHRERGRADHVDEQAGDEAPLLLPHDPRRLPVGRAPSRRMPASPASTPVPVAGAVAQRCGRADGSDILIGRSSMIRRFFRAADGLATVEYVAGAAVVLGTLVTGMTAWNNGLVARLQALVTQLQGVQ